MNRLTSDFSGQRLQGWPGSPGLKQIQLLCFMFFEGSIWHEHSLMAVRKNALVLSGVTGHRATTAAVAVVLPGKRRATWQGSSRRTRPDRTSTTERPSSVVAPRRHIERAQTVHRRDGQHDQREPLDQTKDEIGSELPARYSAHCAVALYNEVRLHSAIGYVTPHTKLAGKEREVFAARDEKLEAAREQRRLHRQRQAA